MCPNRAAAGQNPAPPGRAARRPASWRPAWEPAAGLSGGRRIPRCRVAARRAARRFSLGTPRNSRTNPLVLFDDILDHWLPRGVLDAAILLGRELVQVADERVALGVVYALPQIDGGAEVALRRVQIVQALRRRGQRFRHGRTLQIGEFGLREHSRRGLPVWPGLCR